MANKSTLKVRVQKLGTTLSNMVMPNIGAFIAWGILATLFIETGWFPNPTLSVMVSPILTYLLPLLIGYTAGFNVYGQRGAVVGDMATFGAIVGSSVTMFIGAMIMGSLGAWCIKKFDEKFQEKIRPGFEMLLNNFSAGIIGFILIILAFLAVGPVVSSLTAAIGVGVQAIINAKMLPLANILIEAAKVLFLNNALNHGIFTPLGTEQVAEVGKSILFLLESNPGPGPGLGILLAYSFFGKGSAKSSAPGAVIIEFLGGIHEIYFPYVMMKPLLFLAAIAGGVVGTFTFQLLGAGLSAAASPGSIIAILAMTPRGGYLPVIAGVAAAAVASFLVASVILKADRSESDSLESAQTASQAAKAASKGQEVAPSQEELMISTNAVQQIIFACDAGMGSSAMGASILREKVKKAGLDIPVTNKAISNLTDTPNTLIVTQEELAERVAQKTPSAIHVSVDNFLVTPKYDEIVTRLSGASEAPAEETVPVNQQVSEKAPVQIDLNQIDEVVFAYGKARGSVTMGEATLKAIFKNKGIAIPVSKVANEDLPAFNANNILIVSNIANQTDVQKYARDAQLLVVDSLVTTPEYDKMIARISH